MVKWACGVDPGLQGFFVFTNGEKMRAEKMPICNKNEIDFEAVLSILKTAEKDTHVFLERAVPFAMGSKGAFNYGRGFAALEIAIKIAQLPVTYVEPAKWTKALHAGIQADLKPKAKSLIAVQRLYPSLTKLLPKDSKGQLLDGAVDALLIAGYGLSLSSREDFF